MKAKKLLSVFEYFYGHYKHSENMKEEDRSAYLSLAHELKKEARDRVTNHFILFQQGNLGDIDLFL